LQTVVEALRGVWRGGVVLYTANRIVRIASPDIWALPSRRLLQPAAPGSHDPLVNLA